MILNKKWQRANLFVVLFLSFGFLLTLISVNIPAIASAEESQYFPETKKTLSGKFLQYWREHGGLPIYGYPITDAQPEVDPETGKTFLTQWFERNRFEYHPENAGTKYEILMGLLGKDLKRDVLGSDPAFVRFNSLIDPASPPDQQVYFTETGHNLRGLFYKYWRENGGLEQFGYPISEPYMDTLNFGGVGVFIQWFERARFEYHPGNNPPYIIQLGLLGDTIKGVFGYILPTVNRVLETNPYSTVNPSGLAVDSESNIYVADSILGRVLKYNRNLQLVTSFAEFQGVSAWGTKKIKVDQTNNIYVLKQFNVLYKYNSGGQLLAKLSWDTPPYFNDFAVDANGDIYTLDNTNTVRKFAADGRFLLEWNKIDNNKKLGTPTSIVVDSKKNVYVADTENKAVYRFNSDGAHLATLEFEANNYEYRANYQLAMGQQDNLYLISSNGVGGYVMAKFDATAKLISKSTIDYKSDGFAVDAAENIYSYSARLHALYKQTIQGAPTTWGV